MNGWLLLGAIALLWAFAFSLMYLSLWLEERREREQLKTRFGKYVSPYPKAGENLTYLDEHKFDRERMGEKDGRN